MSQQPSQFGQRAQRTEGQGRQSEYARDPASGRFLSDEEQAQVRQLAQQHPQKVQQAYAQNVPFSAVGLQLPANIGNTGSQVGGGMGQQTQQGSRRGTQQGSQQQVQPQQAGWQGGRQQGGWQGGQQQTQPMRGQQVQQQPQQMTPQQQQGFISAQQEPASNEPGWPGKQGRGADQGAQDRRHSPEFRQRMSQIAQQRPRDPQTGQFLPTGQGGQQRQGGQGTRQQGQMRQQPMQQTQQR